MKMKKYFTLAARVFGLLIFFNGLLALLDFVFVLSLGGVEPVIIAYILAATLVYLGGGIYLLRGAPFLVEFAFRTDQNQTNADYDE